jgi:ABC-2 type transport system ATP-binding protein
MNMISVTSLSKRYGPILAVDEVTFTCEQGTVTGFLGPNGAGKTTTLRALTGLTRSDAGQATIAGHRFAALPNPARVAGTLLDASALHAGRHGQPQLASERHQRIGWDGRQFWEVHHAQTLRRLRGSAEP